jgi:hypothetical protein
VKEVFTEAMKQIVPIPGDWHTSMHLLVVIFLLFCGGFLQVFQYVIQWRNIVKDPKERFQKSSDFVDLIVGELKRELYLKWLKMDCARQASS